MDSNRDKAPVLVYLWAASKSYHYEVRNQKVNFALAFRYLNAVLSITTSLWCLPIGLQRRFIATVLQRFWYPRDSIHRRSTTPALPRLMSVYLSLLPMCHSSYFSPPPVSGLFRSYLFSAVELPPFVSSFGADDHVEYEMTPLLVLTITTGVGCFCRPYGWWVPHCRLA